MSLTYRRISIQRHAWWIQHSNGSYYTILLENHLGRNTKILQNDTSDPMKK